MADLAARAGISRGHVNNIEKGRFVPDTEETIAGLARALQVPKEEVEDRIRLERAGGVDGFRRLAGLLAREGELSTSDKAADVLAAVPGQVRARDLDAGPFPWEVPSKPAAPPPPVTKRLDVYPVGAFKGRVAGPPVGQVEVPEAEAKGVAYAVRVEGDSMDDLDHPKLQPMPEGTIALVKKKASPAPGDVPGRARNPLDEQRPEED